MERLGSYYLYIGVVSFAQMDGKLNAQCNLDLYLIPSYQEVSTLIEYELPTELYH